MLTETPHVVVGCCRGLTHHPLLRIAAADVGGISHIADSPATFELVYRRVTTELLESYASRLERIGLSSGALIDLIARCDEARGAAESGDGPPYGIREVARIILILWSRGVTEEEIDVLLGFDPGATAAFLVRRPPAKNIREIVAGHRAGLTGGGIASRLGMHVTTVRETLGSVGLEPNTPQDRRQAADFRPKVVALARQHIAHRGEPDISGIRESLARDGFELTVTQVKNAVRAARKKGDLPPARRRNHGL